MRAEMVNAPSPGTVVWLHSLTTVRLNGQRALVLSDTGSDSIDAAARGRCAVQLLEDNSTVAVRRSNLSVSPSSPVLMVNPFCIKEAPGTGGLGVYADRDIAAGVRIFAEFPLMTRDLNDTKTTTEALLAPMSAAQQESFHQLHDCQLSGGPKTARGTYHTNSFRLGEFPTRSGIFLTISRFNHSCVPNCYHTWNSNLGMRTVHTDREVKMGEELTLTYGDYDTMSWSARQAKLKTCYNFVCDCEACKVTGKARDTSDRRRAKIDELVDGVVGAVHSHQFGKAVQMVEQRLQLMADEGIISCNKMYNAEFDAFQACKYGQQHKEARKWLQQAHKHSVMVEGSDSPCTEKFAKFLAQPVTARLNPMDL